MTLVETSEREVIEKARTFAASRQSAMAKHFLILPQVEEELLAAVTLLEERERVAAEIASGVIPPENLIFSKEPIVTAPRGLLYCVNHNDSHTDCPVALYEREHVAENRASSEADDPAMTPLDYIPESAVSVPPTIPEYHQQPSPIIRPSRKLSRREQEIEKRRRSDPTGAGRDDIDYSSIEDPEAR